MVHSGIDSPAPWFWGRVAALFATKWSLRGNDSINDIFVHVGKEWMGHLDKVA